MKTHYLSLKTALFTLLFSFAGLGLYAADYCHTPIESVSGTHTVYLTCQELTPGNYQIKIEADQDMTTLGGSFCYVDGVGGYQLNAGGNFVLSADNRTITCDIESATPTNLYTPLYIIFANGGEQPFAWPGDVSWAICSSTGPTDNIAPVMVSAALNGTPGSSSAVINVAATDDTTNPVTRFMVSVNGGTATQRVATAGQITLTGLTASTAYTVGIKAKDDAGNVSANEMTVSFSTSAVVLSPCTGDKGHFATPTDTKIHYVISYNSGTVTYTVTSLTSEPLDFLEVQTSIGSYLATVTGGVGVYAQTGVTDGTILAVRFMYHLNGMPGNDMTSQDINLADANIIAYQVGTCTGSTTKNDEYTNANLSVYPNPTRDFINVSSDEQIARVVVSNMIGQSVIDMTINASQSTIDISQLTAGNYILTTVFANGKRTTEKVTKF